MEIKCGMIVKSVAGHDKDRFYLIVKIQGNKIYISDGKKRLLEKPKLKNKIHLKATKMVLDFEKIKTNKKLREALHKYNYKN